MGERDAIRDYIQRHGRHRVGLTPRAEAVSAEVVDLWLELLPMATIARIMGLDVEGVSAVLALCRERYGRLMEEERSWSDDREILRRCMTQFGQLGPKVGEHEAERNEAIVDAWLDGETYASLGQRYGLSGQRVRTICRDRISRYRRLAYERLPRHEREPGWLVYTPQTWDAA